MTIYYIAEAAYTKTVWFKETLCGISEKCGVLKYKLTQITQDEITNSIPMLMIIGTSPAWVSKIIDICEGFGTVPLIVSSHPENETENTGYVLINHSNATKECIEYLKQCGRENIALFGVNSDSYADNVKTGFFSKNDIFYLGQQNKLKVCFDSFMEKHTKYNAVVCTNYISAVYLISELKKSGVCVPQDLYVVCYGDSQLGKMMSPTITTITLEHTLLGSHAVQIYKYMAKNAEGLSVTLGVPCKIVPAQSTENKPYLKTKFSDSKANAEDFSNDTDIHEIQNLEKLLRQCDKTDFAIINSLQNKKTLSKTAEDLFMSESAVKYRIKKMLAVSEFESFEKICDVYKKYLS